MTRTAAPIRTLLTAALVAMLAAGSALSGPKDPKTDTIKVGANRDISAMLLTPPGAGPFPAVLLLQGENGWEDGDQTMAYRLAEAGYVVLAPEYLSNYGILPQRHKGAFTNFRDLLYRDLCDAVQRLRRMDKVGKVGALGFSTGGYFALWLAATGKVQAAVSYYGELDALGTDTDFEFFKKAFNDQSAPVLLLHGANDEAVPAALAENLDAALTASHSRHALRLYKGAEHGFDRAQGYDAWTATKDALKRTLDWFGANLKP